MATYGQIAFIAELTTPRLVGQALRALSSDNTGRALVPWHRIVNSQGRISDRKEGKADRRQAMRLREEGVFLDRRGRVNFACVGWQGPSWEWLEVNAYDVGALIARSQLLPRHGLWARWRL